MVAITVTGRVRRCDRRVRHEFHRAVDGSPSMETMRPPRSPHESSPASNSSRCALLFSWLRSSRLHVDLCLPHLHSGLDLCSHLPVRLSADFLKDPKIAAPPNSARHRRNTSFRQGSDRGSSTGGGARHSSCKKQTLSLHLHFISSRFEVSSYAVLAVTHPRFYLPATLPIFASSQFPATTHIR